MASNDILVVHLPEQGVEGNASAGMSSMTRAYGTSRPARHRRSSAFSTRPPGCLSTRGTSGHAPQMPCAAVLDSAPDFIQPRQRAGFLPGTRTAKRRRTR